MAENTIHDAAPAPQADGDPGGVIPVAAGEPSTSYSMLEPRMKKVYGAFYKELYYTPERRVLDPKIQELISIAASLVAKCEGCIDGHIKKAMDLGATKEEISETICIAAAINAAAMVDLSDRAASRLNLNHFPMARPAAPAGEAAGSGEGRPESSGAVPATSAAATE